MAFWWNFVLFLGPKALVFFSSRLIIGTQAVYILSNTVCMSQASTHGRAQLKRQKLRVGGYTEKVLEWVQLSPCKGPPRMQSKLPGCTASSLREASPTVEKAISCYKADRLVASLPSFRSVQSALAVRKFRAAGKERCERGHGRVCANL